jgi:hypothetical protein
MDLTAILRQSPLLGACAEAGCVHVSLFGPAIHAMRRYADVDIHAVAPRVNSELFAKISGAAGLTARELGSEWLLEMRHGPFRPEPPSRQLHLILDDTRSLGQSSSAVRMSRAAAGRLLFGQPLPAHSGDSRTCARECLAELERWRNALARRTMPYREWALDREPRLREKALPIESGQEWACALRGAAKAGRLHYGMAMALAGRAPAAGGNFASLDEALQVLDGWVRETRTVYSEIH